ncbi:MAG: hypothetical protein IIB38_06200, partial [Candidatus Hydrogenedentes bacterium]|nr:hypothetical protein [Candidatus Hydrogenedentota bacterium]
NLVPTNAVTGSVEINGRKAMVVGGDFTIRGGAADASIPGKGIISTRMALTHRIPYVRLLDASGGSVKILEKMDRTNIPGGDRSQEAELLHTVPVVSGVMGTVAGLPAVQACLSHFNVMVKNTSRVFVAGPPVLKAALGVDIHKDDLGNETVQVRTSGVIANLAENEIDAINQLRRFLSYMPQSVYEMPPRAMTEDDPERREDELIDVIPHDRRSIYNPHKIIKLIVDEDSFFEIQPLWGKTRITGLARLDGYPVGLMMNNPLHLGGALDKDGGEKTARLIQLCDTFHLPLVYLVDEPGFMIGLEEEQKGALRGGARVAALTALSQTPFISIVLRQVYGVAGGLHYRGGPNMYRRYAWPSGHWGPMHIEGGVAAAYKREIENAPDPDAKRKEIEDRLNELRSPFRTAHGFGIEDLIDPRDTRPLLVDFIRDAQNILETQLGQTSRIPYLP